MLALYSAGFTRLLPQGIPEPRYAIRKFGPRLFFMRIYILSWTQHLTHKINSMKKLFIIIAVAIVATSCASNSALVIPKAVNTVNSVRLNELNLEREDYEILNTATATATITYTESYGGANRKIVGENNEFMLLYSSGKKGLSVKFSGILKFGYLANDYEIQGDVLHPEEVARRVAIYRIINQVYQYGADGVVEPVISTNVEQVGKSIVFQTTVSAKLIKLKTNN